MYSMRKNGVNYYSFSYADHIAHSIKCNGLNIIYEKFKELIKSSQLLINEQKLKILMINKSKIDNNYSKYKILNNSSFEVVKS